LASYTIATARQVLEYKDEEDVCIFVFLDIFKFEAPNAAYG
jgi:hypothetical protein